MRIMQEFPLSFQLEKDEGVFSGYASVFDIIDSQKDVIRRGAFERTIKERAGKGEVRLLWQHRAEEPVGTITALREDSRGLYVEGQLLLEIQRGEEAYALLKNSAIEGLSIGYNVLDSEYDYAQGVRIIKDLELWEISLVTFPANAAATVTHVKETRPQTLRAFEKFLHANGFSRTEAKAAAAHGFPALQPEWEEVCGEMEKLTAILSTEVLG